MTCFIFIPVVFINTANYAMAGHDNNPSIWKWKYTYLDKECSYKVREKIKKGN